MPAAESAKATIELYDGLGFSQMIGYESETGAKVDMTDWYGLCEVRAKVGDEDVLITFATSDGTMVLTDGVIELIAPAEARDWDEGVGHLVAGPSPETAGVIGFYRFFNLPSTTGMPS